MADFSMRVITGILLVVLALVAFPIILEALHDIRTDPKSESFSVTTPAGESRATVTLSPPGHFHTDSVEHITVSSTLTTDIPTPTSYVSATRVLTISGLTPGATRILNVTYEINAFAEYPAFSVVLSFVPIFYVIVMLVFIIGSIFQVYLR